MPTPSISLDSFASFGELLRYLRRRSRLTLRELSIAVGYSEAHLSRLEQNQRLPDLATIAAVFVPALDLAADPATAARLLELAALSRGEPAAPAEPPAEPSPEQAANLPHPLTHFVGREREQARVEALLSGSRLVTLTGPGGSGKTRLALRVASGLAGQAASGKWFLDLAPLADPALVPGALLSALGVPLPRDRPVLDALAAFLRPGRQLVVLDNAEHLVAAAARLAEGLLLACPDLRVLVTSREPLDLPGEAVFAVPPLEADGAASPAVRLFVERARDRLPDFELTEANSPAVVRLCQRLDGLPLAIELAAARLNVLSVDQIAGRLDDRFRLLAGGNRTALPRHQTLRAAMDWSYDLLPETERGLFRRLAVFAGGFGLDAAAALTGEAGVVDVLGQLVSKSLVAVERLASGETRYRLLETVRAYAREKLRQAAEEESAQERHLRFYLAWAESAELGLQGKDQIEWRARLEREHDNLRAALQAASASPSPRLAEAGLRLALALDHFWHVRGSSDERRNWFTRLMASPHQPRHSLTYARALALAAHSTATPSEAYRLLLESLELSEAHEAGPAIAAAHFSRGMYGWVEADPAEARSHFEQSARLYRELDQRWHLSRTLVEMGEFVQVRQDDRAAARACFHESLLLARELGDKRGIALALVHLGDLAIEQGDLPAAHQYSSEGLAAAGGLDDREGLAWALNDLGIVAMAEGRPAEAARLCEESLALSEAWGSAWHAVIRRYWLARAVSSQGDESRAVGLHEQNLAAARAASFDWGQAVSLQELGEAGARRGDLDAARLLQAEALALLHAGRYGYSLAYSLEAFGGLALASGQPRRAVRLFAAAAALRDSIGTALLPPERAEVERAIQAARDTLGSDLSEALTREGRALAPDAAVAIALQPDAGDE